jgi:ATPase family AAA domain-containing protein 3A/B
VRKCAEGKTDSALCFIYSHRSCLLSKEAEEIRGKSSSGGSGGGNAGGGSSVHGFDPSALERAAKAAKDLDKSRNAKDALALISTQESTKQKEHEMERAKYMAMQQELAIRKVQEEEVAAARTMEKRREHDQSLADYKDRLERQRLVEQINAQKHMQDEERQKVEESLMRQEAIRRKTLEYEAELRQQVTSSPFPSLFMPLICTLSRLRWQE